MLISLFSSATEMKITRTHNNSRIVHMPCGRIQYMYMIVLNNNKSSLMFKEIGVDILFLLTSKNI